MQDFKQAIYDFYAENRRSFEWRENITPYKVVVSEIMLQQTQTDRVAKKLPEWLDRFPGFEQLARASTGQVIAAWQGLGYNRRALALHASAQRVMQEFGGQLPEDPVILQTCKGIGPNTAGSICAFAFNLPVVFIETNIRAVYIYHFFKDQEKVSDKELVPLIEQTLDKQNPREWYYALMDYGVFIKKHHKNPSRKSKSYTIQSRFEGSERQIRGAILRVFTQWGHLTFDELTALVPSEIKRVEKNLHDLVHEGFIKVRDNSYYL